MTIKKLLYAAYGIGTQTGLNTFKQKKRRWRYELVLGVALDNLWHCRWSKPLAMHIKVVGKYNRSTHHTQAPCIVCRHDVIIEHSLTYLFHVPWKNYHFIFIIWDNNDMICFDIHVSVKHAREKSIAFTKYQHNIVKMYVLPKHAKVYLTNIFSPTELFSNLGTGLNCLQADTRNTNHI